jgi:hypothetical protein
LEKDTTGIQPDRARDTKGQGRKWTDTQMDRDTDGQGLGHRRTGIGTQTDRENRETDGQGQGHRWTGRGTQTDRKMDTDGQREDRD